MPSQQEIADSLATHSRALAYKGQLNDTNVQHVNALAVSLVAAYPLAVPTPVIAPAPTSGVVAPLPAKLQADPLTSRGAIEIIGHESIVLEWYKDSEGVGTWGIGVTNRSGHNVDRYKDNPSTVERAIEVYIWLLRNRYMPDVLEEFAGFHLSEAQFHAALSFHYNTGAIKKTSWTDAWKAGHVAEARTFLENHYLNGGDLKTRREDEARLFFDGTWTGNGMATVWPVKKPAYTPDWAHPKRVDIRADVAVALAA